MEANVRWGKKEKRAFLRCNIFEGKRRFFIRSANVAYPLNHSPCDAISNLYSLTFNRDPSHLKKKKGRLFSRTSSWKLPSAQSFSFPSLSAHTTRASRELTPSAIRKPPFRGTKAERRKIPVHPRCAAFTALQVWEPLIVSLSPSQTSSLSRSGWLIGKYSSYHVICLTSRNNSSRICAQGNLSFHCISICIPLQRYSTVCSTASICVWVL